MEREGKSIKSDNIYKQREVGKQQRNEKDRSFCMPQHIHSCSICCKSPLAISHTALQDGGKQRVSEDTKNFHWFSPLLHQPTFRKIEALNSNQGLTWTACFSSRPDVQADFFPSLWKCFSNNLMMASFHTLLLKKEFTEIGGCYQ